MTKTDHPYRTGAEITRGIIVTTSNSVEDSKVDRYLGLVRGIVVRSPTIGQGFMGAIKSIGGGNIEEWAEASAHDHEPIFRALEAGDADAARLAMAEHIQHIGLLLTEYLEQRGVFARSEPQDTQ